MGEAAKNAKKISTNHSPRTSLKMLNWVRKVAFVPNTEKKILVVSLCWNGKNGKNHYTTHSMRSVIEPSVVLIAEKKYLD